MNKKTYTCSNSEKYNYDSMIANIRFNDTSKVVNLNCKSGVLLEYIRTCGSFENDIILDLSDKDGNVKNLRANLTNYNNGILQQNETYYLVSVTEEPKQSTYTLLVNFPPGELPFDVKPTKNDKKEARKAATKNRAPSKKAKQ